MQVANPPLLHQSNFKDSWTTMMLLRQHQSEERMKNQLMEMLLNDSKIDKTQKRK